MGKLPPAKKGSRGSPRRAEGEGVGVSPTHLYMTLFPVLLVPSLDDDGTVGNAVHSSLFRFFLDVEVRLLRGAYHLIVFSLPCL
jgi:hypothetical protein